MGLPPYGPEPYASANSATPALVLLRDLGRKQEKMIQDLPPARKVIFIPKHKMIDRLHPVVLESKLFIP